MRKHGVAAFVVVLLGAALLVRVDDSTARAGLDRGSPRAVVPLRTPTRSPAASSAVGTAESRDARPRSSPPSSSERRRATSVPAPDASPAHDPGLGIGASADLDDRDR